MSTLKGFPPLSTPEPETKASEPVYWYRIEDHLRSYVIDADREQYGTRVEVALYRYQLVGITPKGVRLTGPGAIRRLVLYSSVKKFAYPTLNAARGGFFARKRKQIAIYDAKISHARRAMTLALELEEGNAKP